MNFKVNKTILAAIVIFCIVAAVYFQYLATLI